MTRQRSSSPSLASLIILSTLTLGLWLWQAGPALALPDHFTTDVVLGQVRKDTRRTNSADPSTLSGPFGVAVDPVRKHLYVSDPQNGRVLGWKDVTHFKNGAPADLILGQQDGYATERFRNDSKSFGIPSALAVDSQGTLWVADYDNGRVQGFKWPFDPSQTATDNVTTDFMVGQPDYGLGYPDKGCNGGFNYGGPAGPASAQSLCNPSGLAIDGADNLYVADTQNSRVLIFKAPIAAKGTAAAVVIGQATMNAAATALCNRGATVDGTTLCRPQGIFVQQDKGASRLFVVDSDNNRVTYYDDPLNQQTATGVFGQQALTLNGGGVGPDRLYQPIAATMDGQGNLWIADTHSSRIVGYAPPLAAMGAGAAYIIGQLDANGAIINQGIAGKPTFPPSATTLAGARGLATDPKGRLIVVDTANNRVLFYDNPAQMTPAANQVLGQFDFVHGGETRTKQAGIQYPVGIAVDHPAVASGEPDHVYIADTGNSRILGFWDLGALHDGKPADLVIGQKNFADYTCNMGGGVSLRSVCWPRGVTVDKQGNLWVADTWNHRVLRFPAPFSHKDHVADLVLGQTSPLGGLQNGDGTLNPTAHSMNSPSGLVFDDNGILWVADRDNDRVLGFGADGVAFSSAMNANRLLIGPGFPADTTAFTKPGCTVRGNGSFVCGPCAVAMDAAGNLWVADRDNNRAGMYSTQVAMGSFQLNPKVLVALGQPDHLMGALNNGMPLPTAKSLGRPEGISVEIATDNAGKKTTVAIVVADSYNNRVLVYAPISAGFQPPATTVIGQLDAMGNPNFTSKQINVNSLSNEVPINVQNGLWNPTAVLALPQGLMVSDGGGTSMQGVKAGSIQFGFPGTGNNRVTFVKGPSYPQAGPDAAVLADMAGPAQADLGLVPGTDGMQKTGTDGSMTPAVCPTPNSGCSCRVGGETKPLYSVVPLGVVVALGLRRRRQKRA